MPNWVLLEKFFKNIFVHLVNIRNFRRGCTFNHWQKFFHCSVMSFTVYLLCYYQRSVKDWFSLLKTISFVVFLHLKRLCRLLFLVSNSCFKGITCFVKIIFVRQGLIFLYDLENSQKGLIFLYGLENSQKGLIFLYGQENGQKELIVLYGLENGQKELIF